MKLCIYKYIQYTCSGTVILYIIARFTTRPPAIQDFTAVIVAAEGHTAPGMMRTRWPGSQNFLTELENPFLP